MFGKTVYASAISSGVASKTPSAMDGYARGAFPTPSFLQSAATSPNPVRSATLIVARLREWARACRQVMGPSYSFP